MIDIETYRRLALALPESAEQAHMGHPDFRVAGKIFATLRPEQNQGVVMLNVEQQAMLVDAEPAIFRPFPGGWGHRGSTLIDFAFADSTTAASALAMAWRNKAPKRLLAPGVS
jgi:hypothetical protein